MLPNIHPAIKEIIKAQLIHGKDTWAKWQAFCPFCEKELEHMIHNTDYCSSSVSYKKGELYRLICRTISCDVEHMFSVMRNHNNHGLHVITLAITLENKQKVLCELDYDSETAIVYDHWFNLGCQTKVFSIWNHLPDFNDLNPFIRWVENHFNDYSKS